MKTIKNNYKKDLDITYPTEKTFKKGLPDKVLKLKKGESKELPDKEVITINEILGDRIKIIK